jgi:cell division protein FtsZ
MPQVKPELETLARICVIGVGGGGSAAVNRMIASRMRGVEFAVVNTDMQALHHSNAPRKLHIGKAATRGLGAGMDPEVGRRAAEENQNEIREIVKGMDMVFITCGLGGGTGSGASSIIAEIAREAGALTIAVVTKPFSFEGSKRREIAEAAYSELADRVDAIITIPNDRVLQISERRKTLMEAFSLVDDVLRQGVQGISEIITTPAEINVDFADVRTIMREAGSALMGIGIASGENRAAEAAKMAVASPLLDVSIDGARGILFTIAGSKDLGMHEVEEAAKIITGNADDNAKVIFGALIDPELKDQIKITVVATGFDGRDRFREPAQEKQFFAGGRATYNPTPVMRPRQQAEDERSEESTPVKRPAVAPMPSTRPTAAPAQSARPDANQTASDDDLEIPAFIRKRMGM